VKAKDIERARLVEQLRPQYLADLAAGIDRFFEPRRENCPWCDADQLTMVLRTTDLLQHKPGRFELDRCLGCGHVFQNPRLTADGLEFYYRDCYDGLGERQMSQLMGGKDHGTYASRATALTPFANPTTWLDVGTGHGHFPAAARQIFPDTRFDGLDLSAGVELAQQHGRVVTGYRGQFVELSSQLAESYEVVSMFHYLEHTPFPRQQLEAALKVVRTGGHLIIEVPDPECRWRGVLNRWWIPWLQPQHLNFIPVANLRQALTELGFTVLAEQHAEAHGRYDLLPALLLMLHRALRAGENLPWKPHPPAGFNRVLRTVAFAAAVPVFVATALLDRAISAVVSDRGFANAYRIVAVKN
jgi:ubiquinone/menaquinone biosynthesis C-methylase UbiE